LLFCNFISTLALETPKATEVAFLLVLKLLTGAPVTQVLYIDTFWMGA